MRRTGIPNLAVPRYGLPVYGAPTDSGLTVLERLAQCHCAAINDITVVNGYHQTLAATRSTASFWDGAAMGDLATLCVLAMGDGAVVKEFETLDGANSVIGWRQQFDAIVRILGEADGLSEDERITRIIGDIQVRMAQERSALRTNGGLCCNSLASWIDLLPWEIGMIEQEQCTIVNVPISVRFTVSGIDPTFAAGH